MLSISHGVYDDELRALLEPAARLHLAQLDTVDVAWRSAAAVRICSSRWARAAATPSTAGRPAAQDVHRVDHVSARTRRGSSRASWPGWAYRVWRPAAATSAIRTPPIWWGRRTPSAIEVTGHLPAERKKEGLGVLSGLLRPETCCPSWTAPYRPDRRTRPAVGQPQPLPRHPGQLFEALRADGLGIEGYVNHTADALQIFIAPTTVLRQRRHLLRDEFGPLISCLCPLFSVM